MGCNQFWTEQEVQVLRDLAAARLGFDEMQKVLKSRTRHAIKNKCADEKISVFGAGPEIDLDAFKKLMKGRAA